MENFKRFHKPSPQKDIISNGPLGVRVIPKRKTRNVNNTANRNASGKYLFINRSKKYVRYFKWPPYQLTFVYQ
jgi:hypothetical protein